MAASPTPSPSPEGRLVSACLQQVNPDGTDADMTLSLAEQIGGLFIEFREGGTDAFGTCDL